jgi:5-methylcytosine-specific restriction endonuclease McrA
MPSRPRLFRARHTPPQQQQDRAYEGRRGSARRRGYTSAWDKAAKAHRVTHPLCLGCEAIGRVTAAACTDHAVPHKGDRLLFWDSDNWQSACDWHHDVVKQKLELRYAQGKATASDLRLDSLVAVALTLELLGLE